MESDFDIAIIGAGPLGIELHVALKRAGFTVAHFDARQIGGTIAWWAPGTRWFSSPERIAIAGVPLNSPTGEKTTREEYLAYLRGVVTQFDLPIRTYTRIDNVNRNADDTFTLHSQNKTWRARKLILATGGTESPNLLNIPGENLPHVSHYFQDPHTYFRKNLLIVGGKNSAIEAALRAYRAGANVAFSYRRPQIDKDHIKYWLYPEFASFIKSGMIAAYFSSEPIEITPDCVTLRSTETGNAKNIPADFVLLLTGYVADMSLFTQLGVALTGENQVPMFDPDTMETNVKNVYAAGTAIAGTQRGYKVFLENCHVHVDKILASLQGRTSSIQSPHFDRDEA